MKKYIAIIAAIAVLGTAGIVVVNKRLTSKTDRRRVSAAANPKLQKTLAASFARLTAYPART